MPENNTPEKTTKKICEVLFTRKNGNQLLHIKVVPELEKLFKNDEVETSGKYFDGKGRALKYYKLSPKLAEYAKKYSDDFNGMADMSAYGTEFYRDGHYPNYSVMRTVGISRGVNVRVDDLILDDRIQSWAGSLARFLKFMYAAFIQKVEVRATINLEV